MSRTVKCVKLGQELPGLEVAPYPGELGQRIFENISHQAWEMWKEQQVLIINHYNLVLADPRARDFLRKNMVYFLFNEEPEE